MPSRFASQARQLQGNVQRAQAVPSGGVGGGGGGFQDIIAQMQAAQEKANLLNEQRYQQALGQFEGLGKAGMARIGQQTQQRQAAAVQNLTSRGLGSTTITSAVERGIASDAELQRQQLQESVAVQKAGVIERRTDTGPDLGMFASLLQTAGQGQQQQPSRSVVQRRPSVFDPRPMSERIFGTPAGRSPQLAQNAANLAAYRARGTAVGGRGRGF